MNRLIAIPTALLMIIGTLVPVYATEKYSRTVDLSLQVKGEKSIMVSGTSGKIEVRPGQGSEVQVKAIKTCWNRSEDDAEALLKGINVKLESEGDKVMVYAEYISKKVDLGFGKLQIGKSLRDVRVDFYVLAPPNIALDLNATSGDIDVKGMKSDVELNVTSGDCVLSGIGGNVELSATSGDAEIEDVAGSVKVNCTSGDVSIQNAGGDVDVDLTSGTVKTTQIGGICRVETVSGDIEISRNLKSAVARTISGDISLAGSHGGFTLDTTSGDILLTDVSFGKDNCYTRTSSGDVVLKVRKGAGCNIDVSTSSGGIYGRIPIKIETATRHRLIGTVSGGGPRVEISTSSGDVRLMVEGSE